MNIKEINIDENLIIPIPKGFTKQQLAIASANYAGYQKEIVGYTNMTFTGSKEEFDKIFPDKILGENFWIIEIQNKEEGIVEINYQISTFIKNPNSILDFGICQAIKPTLNFLKQAIESFEIKEQELMITEIKEKIQNELLDFNQIIAY